MNDELEIINYGRRDALQCISTNRWQFVEKFGKIKIQYLCIGFIVAIFMTALASSIFLHYLNLIYASKDCVETSLSMAVDMPNK